jgi:hypothetical protein
MPASSLKPSSRTGFLASRRHCQVSSAEALDCSLMGAIKSFALILKALETLGILASPT